MARGSEQFAFKRHPNIPRECYFCGRALKRNDVADVREFPVAYFVCRGCHPNGRGAKREPSQVEFYGVAA